MRGPGGRREDEVVGPRFAGAPIRPGKMLWFEADESGDPAPLADDELDAVGWFHEDALPEPLFPPLVKLLAGRTLA